MGNPNQQVSTALKNNSYDNCELTLAKIVNVDQILYPWVLLSNRVLALHVVIVDVATGSQARVRKYFRYVNKTACPVWQQRYPVFSERFNAPYGIDVGYNPHQFFNFTPQMAQFFAIHPENPQLRLIHRAVEIIQKGGVIAYPTDVSYALACHIGDKGALDKIRRIRQLDDKHDFTLVCSDLTQISMFTKMGNNAHRLIKALTPGPFTFILDATREVPRRLQHPKKKTIGIRVPDHPVAQLLVEELQEPLFSSTLMLPGDTDGLSDPYEIRERLEHELDLVIDAGMILFEETTIISFSENNPEIVRQGKGIAPMLN